MRAQDQQAIAARRRAGYLRMLIPAGILIASFLAALALTQGTTSEGGEVRGTVFPSGMAGIASLFVTLTLPPTALVVFIIAGILAPPRPFITGALVGAFDGVLWSLLFLIAPDDGFGHGTGLADYLLIIAFAAGVGLIVTGIIGTIANLVLDRSRRSQAGPAIWPGMPTSSPCPRCGAATVPGASFCRDCGLQLDPPDEQV